MIIGSHSKIHPVSLFLAVAALCGSQLLAAESQPARLRLSINAMSSTGSSFFPSVEFTAAVVSHEITSFLPQDADDAADLIFQDVVAREVVSTAHKIILCNNTTIKRLVVKQIKKDLSGSYLPSVVVIDNATVEGNISFENAPGYVVLRGNSQLDASAIINGTIIDEAKAAAIGTEKKLLTGQLIAAINLISQGELDQVKAFVERQGINPATFCVPLSLLSMVSVAARSDKFGTAQWLVEQGAPVEGVVANGYSMLHAAVMRGQESFVKTLLKHGAQVNIASTGKEKAVDAAEQPTSKMMVWEEVPLTPLMIAALQGNAPMVKLLLDAGADITMRAGGKTIFDYPEMVANHAIKKLLSTKPDEAQAPTR